MDRKVFNNEVVYAVELEYEMGGRSWKDVKGKDLNKFLELHKGELSDLDFNCHQDNEEVKRVLNLAHINWYKNHEWVAKRDIHSFDDLVDYILNNKLDERK